VEFFQSVDPVSRVIFDTFEWTLDPESAILPNYLTARNDLVEGHLRSKPELTSIYYVELRTEHRLKPHEFYDRCILLTPDFHGFGIIHRDPNLPFAFNLKADIPSMKATSFSSRVGR